MKLAIGIPTGGGIKTKTIFSLFRMMRGRDFELIIKEGGALHADREDIVKTAIKLGCTHLLFIDSDMYFEKDAVDILLSRNKDIIGTHYNQRRLPPTSTVVIDVEKKKKLKETLTTCDALGTGFLLINLDVFKKIKQPWFFWECDDKGVMTCSEDFWFCRKAKEAGYEIWLDLSVSIKHVGDYLY